MKYLWITSSALTCGNVRKHVYEEYLTVFEVRLVDIAVYTEEVNLHYKSNVAKISNQFLVSDYCVIWMNCVALLFLLWTFSI